MMPLTSQEEEVRNMLIEERLPFESHHVFDLRQSGRLAVDFLVFRGPGIVLECTVCSTSRGRALRAETTVRLHGLSVRAAEGLVSQATLRGSCRCATGRPGATREPAQADSEEFGFPC